MEWERFLPTGEATLNHRVVGVLDFGCCHFLGFFLVAGFDFYDEALVVESDYLDGIEFEAVVGVERGGGVVHYVGHDFEV